MVAAIVVVLGSNRQMTKFGPRLWKILWAIVEYPVRGNSEAAELLRPWVVGDPKFVDKSLLLLS